MQLSQASELVATQLQHDISQFFSEWKKSAGQYDPVGLEVINALEEYCLRPGKAMRPLLVYAGYALAKKVSLEDALREPRAQKLALLVELTQDRILMADDVADQDDMRRGQPSYHRMQEGDLIKRFANTRHSHQLLEHTARTYTEVAGMWLQNQIQSLLFDSLFTDTQRRALWEVFRENMYDRTVIGWQMLYEQGLKQLVEVSEEEFLKGLQFVTSYYSCVGPLTLGWIAADVQNPPFATYQKLGEAVGVLFQVVDDQLGLFGDPAITGKPVGNDVREGKKTLFVQYAYQAATPEEKQQLIALVGKHDITSAEVAWVQDLVRRTGADQRVGEAITTLKNDAQEALQALGSGEAQDLLSDVLSFIATRKK